MVESPLRGLSFMKHGMLMLPISGAQLEGFCASADACAA
jgi:hypothetical protein